MNSGLYSFYQIIERLKIATGIQNLRNRYTDIRTLIAAAEYEINPYAAFLIKKKMVHYVGNGVFDGKSIKKPADYVSLDAVGCCHDGLCKGAFYETISHIVICDSKQRKEITWTYWGLNYDGEGNPVVTYNHAEAVVNYLIWQFYSPRVFSGQGNANLLMQYQRNFEDRASEARGEDFFPSADGLCKIWQINKMSSFDFAMIGCDHCSACECVTTIKEEKPMDPEKNKKIWYWQDNSQAAVINSVDDITDSFLSFQQTITLEEAMDGYTFGYPYVGRLGFCVDDASLNEFEIIDLLSQPVVQNMNVYYNDQRRWLIFISKEYYNPSSIYFKFIQNE